MFDIVNIVVFLALPLLLFCCLTPASPPTPSSSSLTNQLEPIRTNVLLKSTAAVLVIET
jgi:hypothetical protein